MKKEDNRKSLAFGVPGLVLQLGGKAEGYPLITLVGSILLLVGLAYYAKGKGRHPAWGLFGLLSIIGVIILACMKDNDAAELNTGRPTQ